MYSNIGPAPPDEVVVGGVSGSLDNGLLGTSPSPGGRARSGPSKAKKDKPSKVSKKQTRFPKRSTK